MEDRESDVINAFKVSDILSRLSKSSSPVPSSPLLESSASSSPILSSPLLFDSSSQSPQRNSTAAVRLPSPIPYASPTAYVSLTRDRPNFRSTIEWGRDHPDFDRNEVGQRAVWSDDEVVYIAQFVNQYKGKGNIVARCLVKIHEDPKAHPIFHAFHTLDSSRLRSGFDRYRQDPERYLRGKEQTDAILIAEAGPIEEPVKLTPDVLPDISTPFLLEPSAPNTGSSNLLERSAPNTGSSNLLELSTVPLRASLRRYKVRSQPQSVDLSSISSSFDDDDSDYEEEEDNDSENDDDSDDDDFRG